MRTVTGKVAGAAEEEEDPLKPETMNNILNRSSVKVEGYQKRNGRFCASVRHDGSYNSQARDARV